MRTLISDDENHVHTVVFDVDGVLLDVAHRLPLCPGRPGVDNDRWDVYHGAAYFDTPIPGGIALANLLYRAGYDVVLVTNRPEDTRRVTRECLEREGVMYTSMFMREDGGSHGSKEWVLERLHLPTVKLAVDDDRKHLEMYAAAGIPTLYVHSGYYDGITDDVYYGNGHYLPGSGEASTTLRQLDFFELQATVKVGGTARVTDEHRQQVRADQQGLLGEE